MHGAPKEGEPPSIALRALRCFGERSPTPLLVTEGPLHVVLGANPAFVELLCGDDARSPVSRRFVDVFPELPPGAGAALLDDVYATGAARQSPSFERLHSRRGERVVTLCVWPTLDDGEGPRRLVIEARDRTDEAREIQRGRELAEETRRINERLVVAGVRMQELVDEAESARNRLAIIAESGGLLGASLDVAAMSQGVARLLVGRLVDVCAIELLEAPGVAARSVLEPRVLSPDAAHAIARLRARSLAADDATARQIHALGFAGGLSIPLRSPNQLVAVLTVLRRRGALDPLET